MTTDTNAGPVLPPLPARDGMSLASLAPYWLARSVEGYAEQVAAPLRQRIAELEGRLRSVCQTLVGAVGADGPCNAEDAAARAVERIAELEREKERLIEDRARFPDRPDDVGNMIHAHIKNLERKAQHAESAYDRLRAELSALREREKACATMDEAEKVALVRGLQELGSALCLQSPSPADLVAAVVRLRAENEALASCLRECADDLAEEINARAAGELARRIDRDLAPVREANRLLAARAKRSRP